MTNSEIISGFEKAINTNTKNENDVLVQTPIASFRVHVEKSKTFSHGLNADIINNASKLLKQINPNINLDVCFKSDHKRIISAYESCKTKNVQESHIPEVSFFYDHQTLAHFPAGNGWEPDDY